MDIFRGANGADTDTDTDSKRISKLKTISVLNGYERIIHGYGFEYEYGADNCRILSNSTKFHNFKLPNLIT